jgi:hypothetical protein
VREGVSSRLGCCFTSSRAVPMSVLSSLHSSLRANNPTGHTAQNTKATSDGPVNTLLQQWIRACLNIKTGETAYQSSLNDLVQVKEPPGLLCRPRLLLGPGGQQCIRGQQTTTWGSAHNLSTQKAKCTGRGNCWCSPKDRLMACMFASLSAG